MALKLLFESDRIEIGLDTEFNWLDVNWKGQQTVESIHAGGEKMLELLRSNGCSKVLNDNTNVVGFWPQTKWAGEEWFPAMAEAGLRHFAWIFSPSIYGRVSTNEAILSTPTDFYQKVSIQPFIDIEAARKWLREIE